MIRKLILLSLCFFSFTSFALSTPQATSLAALTHGCMQAPATDSYNFCIGFRASAYCHCIDSGMDSAVCEDMNQLYNDMIIYFNSVDSACDYQKAQDDGVPQQVCIDDWSCYRKGGRNSQGGLCSGTGQACQ